MAVTIKSGGNKHVSDKYIGMSIGEIRRRYYNEFDISNESQANLSGGLGSVDDYYILQDGDKVTFAKPTGTKG